MAQSQLISERRARPWSEIEAELNLPEADLRKALILTNAWARAYEVIRSEIDSAEIGKAKIDYIINGSPSESDIRNLISDLNLAEIEMLLISLGHRLDIQVEEVDPAIEIELPKRALASERRKRVVKKTKKKKSVQKPTKSH